MALSHDGALHMLSATTVCMCNLCEGEAGQRVRTALQQHRVAPCCVTLGEALVVAISGS